MIPIWLSVAKAFIGIAEVPGPASNPTILRWARDIGTPSWYDNDDQAWCAVFMNRILLACQLPMSGTGFALIRAESFTTWGMALDQGPTPGAVMVFGRYGGGHVGFYVGESSDGTMLRILGGNQGNHVSEMWVATKRLLTTRWPAGVDLPAPGRVVLKMDGTSLSQNEA